MPRIFKSGSRIPAVMTFVMLIIAGIIVYYYMVSFSSFTRSTAVTVHDDIIQGLSQLGSVAIAVITFRILSLENRNHSLEQATLNYISQNMGWSYPEWTSSLENDIKNKTLTNRYYSNHHLKDDALVAAEKKRQQQRLEEAVDLHTRIKQTIHRTRNDVISCAVFLLGPLLLSLPILMVIDFLDVFWIFMSVSIVVLMGSLGIMLLIKMVLGTTVKETRLMT
ncbi:MAG TPA: hypothetical protein VF893_06565 [Candidatus Bathyarchaeia archaeon]